MSGFTIKKAEKKKRKLRLALVGASKSGKTLRVASSEGNKPVEIELNGKKTTIVVGFNAYRKPEAA